MTNSRTIFVLTLLVSVFFSAFNAYASAGTTPAPSPASLEKLEIPFLTINKAMFVSPVTSTPVYKEPSLTSEHLQADYFENEFSYYFWPSEDKGHHNCPMEVTMTSDDIFYLKGFKGPFSRLYIDKTDGYVPSAKLSAVHPCPLVPEKLKSRKDLDVYAVRSGRFAGLVFACDNTNNCGMGRGDSPYMMGFIQGNVCVMCYQLGFYSSSDAYGFCWDNDEEMVYLGDNVSHRLLSGCSGIDFQRVPEGLLHTLVKLFVEKGQLAEYQEMKAFLLTDKGVKMCPIPADACTTVVKTF